MKHITRISIAILVAALATAPAAQSQIGTVAAFPTADETDTRMLSFGCVGTDTFEQDVSISIAVPASETAFDISIFDGDTSGPSGNWDLRAGSPAGRQLVFELYFDPEKLASTADLVARWFGNSTNPLVSPSPDPNKQWTTAQATMPNNDWWTVTVETPPDPLDDPAAAPSGNRFYHMLIKKNSDCVLGEELVSNMKFATSTPETFIIGQFGFEAAFRAGVNDRNIIYPAHPGPGPIPPLDAPTTYDGTYDFFINVPLNAVDLEIYNGDFDHGINTAVGGAAFPGPTGIPSGADLTDPTVVGGICADTDDANTPNDYSDFPPALILGGAVNEGANAPGDPPDDNKLDIARRGWLENQAPANPNPTNAGCVRYSVIDPNGVEYTNNNPSGNLEWQRFRIATINAAAPNTADYGPAVAQDGVTFVTTDVLPAGVWTISIEGLDLANLNFWFLENGTCALVDGEPSCPPTAYLLGDTLFFDFDGDGVQDPGDSGIPGVIVNLFLDPTEPPVGTRITGDTSAPEWADCVANNTGLPGDTDGLYCFGVDDPDTYTVRIAPENFDPGGALFGLISTTGGEEITDVLSGCGLSCGADDNVLTYDFGYTGGSLGDRVWRDDDRDGVQDPGEPGIDGVTVELLDGNGDVVATDVTEPDAGVGDGKYLFEELPGDDYTVRVVTSTLPPGLAQTFDIDGLPTPDSAAAPLDPGENRRDVDFGYAQCGACDGKVTELTLQYLGTEAAFITVFQKGFSTPIFSGPVDAGDPFSFTGIDRKGTMGSEISVYVDGGLHVNIHTSCSQPIGAGQQYGDFLILAGASRNGGALCPTGGVVCGECKSKALWLTLLNDGPAAVITVEQKDGQVVFGPQLVGLGETFTFYGAEDNGTLGTDITVEVGGVQIPIHTSCSQPLEVGSVFCGGIRTPRCVEVTAGASLSGGAFCPLE